MSGKVFNPNNPVVLNEVFTPVLIANLSEFRGKNVGFVGKVKSNDGKTLVLTDNDGKQKSQLFSIYFIEKEITIEDFNGDTGVSGYVEVRGVAGGDKTIEFKAMTQYNEQFNLGQYEEMVTFGQTMHKDSLITRN